MDYYTNVIESGNNILYRGIKNGKRVSEKVKFSPSLFVLSKNNKPTKYKTLDGLFLEKIDFADIREAKEFCKQYKDVHNFKIYGNTSFEYVLISEKHEKEIHWNKDDLLIYNLDIEVGSENGFPVPSLANEEITAITIKTNRGRIFAFGCMDFDTSNTPLNGGKYIKCKNEIDLIEKFLLFWTSNYPDIITGWYIKFFDMPYIINRIRKLFGEEMARKISPWGYFYERKALLMGKEQSAYVISGIATLDYMELYRKFAKNGTARENYKLDTICHIELGEKKLSYAEYESLHRLYKENPQLFMEYNIRDVNLVDMLDNKLKLMDLALTLAYDSKSNYEDIFTQTRMWDAIIFNWLKKDNIIIPPKRHFEKTERFRGAAVKAPLLGRHTWLVSFDLTSLYPHIQMGWNLSPETIIEPENYPQEIKEWISKNNINVETLLNEEIDLSILKKYNYCITPNMQLFKRDFQGFLPKIINQMFEDRKRYKNLMQEAERELEKIDQELERRKNN
jgi:DNA polymerase elongation subunit (family B)